MKKILIIAIALLSFTFVSQLQAQTSLNKATMEFPVVEYDFGEVTENGGDVTYKFEFVNNGTQPIVINNVESQCGCTTPEWSREPILPGMKGYVTAKYHPKNRPGSFNKTITVIANAPESPITLRITGEVIQN